MSLTLPTANRIATDMSAARDRSTVLRVGTRGSALALTQTEAVIGALRARFPEVTVEPAVITTDGDVDKTSPLTAIGGRGVFTSALQEALRRGTIDAAVHSAKDLPSAEPAGLAISAFLQRDDPRDVFVSRHGLSLADSPPRPTIGTSSRRRAVQILAARPDARIVDLRGNIDTRIRKAFESDLDGIVLAAAGMLRMGWHGRVTEFLPLDRFVPSPGQGALAIETRERPTGADTLFAVLDDPIVSVAVRTERAFLRGIGGGCTTPVGAFASIEDEGRLRLRCMLANADGARVVWAEDHFPVAEAEEAAFALARQIAHEVGANVWSAGPWGYVTTERVLAGVRVLVTRAADQAGGLVEALTAVGAEPILAPTIRIAPAADPAALDAALSRLISKAFDWVIFTSSNSVDQVISRLDDIEQGAGAFAGTRVAAIGEATARRLARAGVEISLVPQRSDAEGLLEAMVACGVDEQRVLLPQSNLARDVLRCGLSDAGAVVEAVAAYRTLPVEGLEPTVWDGLNRGDIDVVTFGSPSSVRNLVRLLGADADRLKAVAVACVGSVTAQAAREVGLRVDIVSEDATASGFVAALVAHRDRIGSVRQVRVSTAMTDDDMTRSDDR